MLMVCTAQYNTAGVKGMQQPEQEGRSETGEYTSSLIGTPHLSAKRVHIDHAVGWIHLGPTVDVNLVWGEGFMRC